MPISEALIELKKCTKDFENIGDADKYIKESKDDFLAKWAKVNQYYNRYGFGYEISITDVKDAVTYSQY